VRQVYFSTELIDRQIREAYASGDLCRKRGHAAVRDLCRRLGWPKHAVYRRALRLGCIPPTVRKEPPWTAAEDAIAVKNAHLTPHTIARKLGAAGYARTPNAVRLRLHRAHQLGRGEACGDKGLLTANQAAALLGMSHPKQLTRWIEQGVLRATRDHAAQDRPDGRVTAYRIRETDLRDLLIHYTAHFNFARIDKFWLVDLLTGQSVEKRAAA
jgi:hypothetical protein